MSSRPQPNKSLGEELDAQADEVRLIDESGADERHDLLPCARVVNQNGRDSRTILEKKTRPARRVQMMNRPDAPALVITHSSDTDKDIHVVNVAEIDEQPPATDGAHVTLMSDMWCVAAAWGGGVSPLSPLSRALQVVVFVSGWSSLSIPIPMSVLRVVIVPLHSF